MKTLILFSLLVLAFSKFPCQDRNKEPISIIAYPNDTDLQFKFDQGVITGTWHNVRAQQKKFFQVKGWSYQQISSPSQLTSILFTTKDPFGLMCRPLFFKGLSHGQQYQKQSKITSRFNFQNNVVNFLNFILLAKRSTAVNQSFVFTLQAYKGAYNFNNTCIQECNGRMRYAAEQDGKTSYEQFECVEEKKK